MGANDQEVPRWVFVMEPNRCIDCEACMVACTQENSVPLGSHRNWIDKSSKGSFPAVSQFFAPENCHHCTNPPCERVCPTGATYQPRRWSVAWTMTCALAVATA